MEDLQYLTFYIGDEIFALDLLVIKEIIPYEEITKIPLMQEFILGVINLRGEILPIVDLNKRIELNTKQNLKKSSIIVISIEYEKKKLKIGIVVDIVSKVFSFKNNNLELSPLFGTKIKKKFIKQEAKVDDIFIPILNTENILNIDELSQTLQEAI